MMRALVLLLVLASPALASEEEIHPWSSVTITASTHLFGDVTVTATADAKANVKTVEVKVKGKSITVPAKLIESLPAMPLASLEIRSEVGYDKDPWLYVFFRRGPANVKDSVAVHIAFQAGKLKDASIDTYDGKNGSKHETKKAP